MKAVQVLAVCSCLAATACALTVWPKPQAQTDDGKTYVLDPNFVFSPTGADSTILRNAIWRYTAIITGGATLGFASVDMGAADGVVTSMEIDVTSPDMSLDLKTNETYSLTITAPTSKLTAVSVYGALRGLETFSQLVSARGEVNGTTIDDFPRFQFRATMIDTSRHYYPATAIYQHIDAMAYNKMNVLHWHIVDSVSFPYESAEFPQMSRSGAYSPTHVYTRDAIAEIITYAGERGIRVIPEFDTPGHVFQGFNTIPDLLTPCYSNGKPDGTFGPIDPTLNSTYEFMTKFFADVKDAFTDKFIHVGGDEVSFDCWQSNPKIAAFMKANNIPDYPSLEQYYELNLLEVLKKQGSSYICWEEIFDNGVKILPDTVVDVWKGGWQDTLAKVTKAGYNAVLSNPYYLNYISYGEDWPKYYTVEPTNFTGNKDLLSGIETCMWSEFVDATNFIARFWPRASAVAERAWSAEDVNDPDVARPRLHEMRCKMLTRGINAEPAADGGYYDGIYSFCEKPWVPAYNTPWPQ